MQKVKVSEDPALSARYPEGAPGRVTIRLKSGATQWLEIRYPRGHEKNPMSDAEIEQKFHTMCAGRLDGERRTAALALLRRLETVGDVSEVTALFAVA
jgi:2-methylcitrate dehydratase